MSGPPLRIRVVSHPPLPPVKAWLPIPSTSATIADLARAAGKLVGSRPILFELLGFELMSESACSMLDCANDVLDMKAARTEAPVSSASILPAAPTSASVLQPQPSGKIVSIPAASSSSSDESSSESDTSSSDEEPEQLSSKNTIVPNVHHLAAKPPPAKRIRLDPELSSSDSDSSSDSSSSSSDSDSESGSSSDESDVAGSKSNPATKPINRVVPTVPPGAGLKRTKKRNERRRTLRAARSDSNLSSLTSAHLPSPAPSNSTYPTPRTNQVKRTAPAGSKSKDPYGGYDQTKTDMLSLAAGNKNKKKTIRLPRPGESASGSKIIFEQDTASIGAEKSTVSTTTTKAGEPGSPTFTPGSPNITPAEYVPSASSLPTESATKASQAATPYNLSIPSHRTDLPPNIVVRKVDVEAKGWEAGLGKLIEGTSKDYKPVSSTSSQIPTPMICSAVEQSSVVGKRTDQPAVMESAPFPKAQKKDLRNMTPEDVSRSWASYPILNQTEAKKGQWVAVQLLELDTITFVPTLSTKFGTLQPPKSDNPLCIKLHPSCIPSEPDEEEGMYDDYSYGGEESWIKPKLKFGMDLASAMAEDEEAAGRTRNGNWRKDIFEGAWTEVRLLQ